MKILLLTEQPDMFFHLLSQALNKLDTPVGHAPFPIDQSELDKFAPDIIIHNSNNKVQHGNAIVIGINETRDPNTFSYKDRLHPNFIKPFVTIDRDLELEDEKYKTDVVYVGNPSLLPDCINELEDNVIFKILNNTPVPISNYCGACSLIDYKKFFHMSKCSIINESDSDKDIPSFKLLDVLHSGGNPVCHHGDDEQFMKDIKDAISGKSFKENFMTPEEITKNHSNFSRMHEILSKVGLNKLAKMVLDSKDK